MPRLSMATHGQPRPCHAHDELDMLTHVYAMVPLGTAMISHGSAMTVPWVTKGDYGSPIGDYGRPWTAMAVTWVAMGCHRQSWQSHG